MPQNMQIETVLILFAPRLILKDSILTLLDPCLTLKASTPTLFVPMLTLKDSTLTLRESKLSLIVTNWQITHPLMRKSTASSHLPEKSGQARGDFLDFWFFIFILFYIYFSVIQKKQRFNNSPLERGWGCVLFICTA